MITDSIPLVLASASPRRLELLLQIGLSPNVTPADIDESVRRGEHAADYVKRMAFEKAQRVAHLSDAGAVVLGSDTSVVVDDDVLGKPESREHAAAMLRQLSGRTHQVMSAVCVMKGNRSDIRLSITQVCFVTLSDAQIARYWASGEPQGKAGGYAIQGLGATFIKHIEGSYSGVMGLPIFETAELLKAFGIATL